MRARNLIPFFLILIALAACQAAATEEPDIVVETVVSTELIEGESVEVVVTATGGPSGSPLAMVVPGSRMVIKDAELNLLVDDTDQAIGNVTQLAADRGGYIISSRTWFDDEYKLASLRLAIPSDTFESTLNTLRLFAVEVLSETASGQDVTAEYVDLETRLTNLEATAERVRELLAQAKDVEESLKVSNELSNLEGQISAIKGQMRYFETRAAFSTVTVMLNPQRPTPTPSPTATPSPTPTPEVWSPGATFQQASETLGTIARGLTDLLIWGAVVPGPFLVVGGLIYSAVIRRRRKTAE